MTISRTYGGSGLGLTICRDLGRRRHGRRYPPFPSPFFFFFGVSSYLRSWARFARIPARALGLKPGRQRRAQSSFAPSARSEPSARAALRVLRRTHSGESARARRDSRRRRGRIGLGQRQYLRLHHHGYAYAGDERSGRYARDQKKRDRKERATANTDDRADRRRHSRAYPRVHGSRRRRGHRQTRSMGQARSDDAGIDSRARHYRKRRFVAHEVRAKSPPQLAPIVTCQRQLFLCSAA